MLPSTTHLSSLPFPRCEVIDARQFRPSASGHLCRSSVGEATPRATGLKGTADVGYDKARFDHANDGCRMASTRTPDPEQTLDL